MRTGLAVDSGNARDGDTHSYQTQCHVNDELGKLLSFKVLGSVSSLDNAGGRARSTDNLALHSLADLVEDLFCHCQPGVKMGRESYGLNVTR